MIATLPSSSFVTRQMELFHRAQELQIPCWSFDASCNMTSSPVWQGNHLDPERSTAIVTAAGACRAKNKALLTRPFDDMYLLAMPDPQGAVVADFSTVGSSDLTRNQLIKILTNYHNDLSRIAQDQLSIDGFNVQLSQSYEEVKFIYRMATFLTSYNEPCQVVQMMCEELREVLGYGWVTLVFGNGPSLLSSLHELTVHSGQLPCDLSTFRRESLAIDPMKTGRVLSPGKNALATIAGSELLVERVMHNDSHVGLLIAGNRQGSDPDVSSYELQLVEATASFLGLFHQNTFRFSQQRKEFLGMLHAFSTAVDAKDPYTHGHSQRVGLLAAQLAAKLGFDNETVEAFRIAGLLHDVGKIGVPEAVLRKTSKLTDEEFDLIKQHPEIGYQILKDLPSLSSQLPGVLHHHERWDGRGYPGKLRGEEIPMIARVLAFADTFDAMSSNRSYRNAMPRSRVLEEIRTSSGTQFDPLLVESFVSIDFLEFDKLFTASAAKIALQDWA